MAMTIRENNSMLPLVSIGMPVYNGARFISVALQSLLDQSYQNFELIVSDNGSTDNTANICEEFAEKGARVRYIHHKENRGAIENFNYVLDQARGKYFMWAASDDLWDRGWVEALVPLMTDSVGLAFGQLRTIDGLGNILRVYPMREFSTNPLQRSLQYFLREETLGKTNLIYGLWRRDFLSPIPVPDNPHSPKSLEGWDARYIFDVIQRHHIAVAGGVYFYKRQPAPPKAPRKEHFASSVLLVRRIPYYLKCIRSANDIYLKLIMCLLVLPKYAVSVCFNVARILARRISLRQARQA
jgi:glycosyltransferase involved in cell wall biosynthesis